jgi:hypothetical protein
MKSWIPLVLALVFLAGCGQREPAPATEIVDVPGSEVGTTQPVGRFEVTLTIEEPIQAGDRRVEVLLTREAVPVEDASVVVDLSMPGVQRLGPNLDLVHSAGGRYVGLAHFSMGGEWQATVHVSAEGEEHAAVYDFVVVDRTEALPR